MSTVHPNDKYKLTIKPDKLTIKPDSRQVGQVESIDDPIMLISWMPEVIPDPNDVAAWRAIWDECDGVAMAEEFGLVDHEGKVIFLKETDDESEANFTVNENLMENFRRRRIRLLEA